MASGCDEAETIYYEPGFIIRRFITGLETRRPVQPRRVNNLSALMIECGQFFQLFIIFFFGKKCENQEDDFT